MDFGRRVRDVGKSQCGHCGHIVTGFEDQEWRLRGDAAVRLLAEKDREIAELRAALAART